MTYFESSCKNTETSWDGVSILVFIIFLNNKSIYTVQFSFFYLFIFNWIM